MLRLACWVPLTERAFSNCESNAYADFPFVWEIAGHFFASEHSTTGSTTAVPKQNAERHLNHAICSRFSWPNQTHFHSSHRHPLPPFADNTINPLIYLHPDSDLLQHKHTSKIFPSLLFKAPFHVCGYIPPLSGQQSRAS